MRYRLVSELTTPTANIMAVLNDMRDGFPDATTGNGGQLRDGDGNGAADVRIRDDGAVAGDGAQPLNGVLGGFLNADDIPCRVRPRSRIQ
jgi:hypothetical protein